MRLVCSWRRHQSEHLSKTFSFPLTSYCIKVFRFLSFSFFGPVEQQSSQVDKFFFLEIKTRCDLLAGIM